MNPLDELELEIPPIENDLELLEAAQRVYDDVTWSIIWHQALLIELLKHTPGPTPGNLAWIIFWTRAYQALEGLRGSVPRRSLLTCRILERSLYEEMLQLAAIHRPMVSRSVRMSQQSRKRSVEGRMVAYLAWCLWNDLEAWRRFLQPANLRVVYDPAPHRELERLSRDVPPILRRPVETLTDAEAELERKNAAAFARRRVGLLEHLLSDPRLASQAEELERRRPKSFFELLNEDEDSTWKFLAGQDMRFAYVLYQEGSSAVHGSSVENILFWRHPVVAPQVGATDDELKKRVDRALSWARSCVDLLLHLKPWTRE